MFTNSSSHKKAIQFCTAVQVLFLSLPTKIHLFPHNIFAEHLSTRQIIPYRISQIVRVYVYMSRCNYFVHYVYACQCNTCAYEYHWQMAKIETAAPLCVAHKRLWNQHTLHVHNTPMYVQGTTQLINFYSLLHCVSVSLFMYNVTCSTPMNMDMRSQVMLTSRIWSRCVVIWQIEIQMQVDVQCTCTYIYMYM